MKRKCFTNSKFNRWSRPYQSYP